MALRRRFRRAPLSDFGVAELYAFMRGWHPGCGRGRWATWDEFFDDADAVREELMSDPLTRELYGDLEPFADRLRRELQPGQVYDSHGGWDGHCGRFIAVRHSHIFTPGDEHRHDGGDEGSPPSLSPAGGREREAVMA